MSAITVRTVVTPTPDGVSVTHHAQEGSARRRWKAVALALAALLLYGPALGLTVVVLRWDVARAQRVAVLEAQLEGHREETRCWRKLAQRRTRVVSWIREANWVLACMEEEVPRYVEVAQDGKAIITVSFRVPR